MLAALAAIALAAGCDLGAGDEQSKPLPRQEAFTRGGTLRIAATGWFDPEFDPHLLPSPRNVELARCCLARTLLSYNGKQADRAGTELRPDLAASMPSVSNDGLTWRFRLKRGLRYAPPFADREIVAEDFVRGLERQLRRAPKGDPLGFRTAHLGAVAPLYLIIEGAAEFAAGDADTISGLEAPDPHTLVVHLTEQSGDLAYRFSLPASAPIPPGATDGHDYDYGRFFVSSGPYMIDGSRGLDPTLPPTRQRPLAGYVPGRRLVLVRNPSWRRERDLLRPAYADRIELELLAPKESRAAENVLVDRLQRRIDEGKVDVIVDPGSSFTSAATLARYRRDPTLKRRLALTPDDAVEYIAFKLAVPPFDDVHVRKAVSLLTDKAAVLRLCCVVSVAAGHIVPDSLESNLLLDYDPYRTPGLRGSVRAARAEMAKSRYDRDRDGVCDRPACKGIRVAARQGIETQAGAAAFRRLPEIGLVLRTDVLDFDAYGRALAPTAKYGIVLSNAWGKDFPNPSSLFLQLFYGPGLRSGRGNVSLVGATNAQLRGWGHRVRSVPSMDEKIEECVPLVGDDQIQCWAEADRLLMEEIVAVIPVIFSKSARTLSPRVVHFESSALSTFPSLDQIALRQPG